MPASSAYARAAGSASAATVRPARMSRCAVGARYCGSCCESGTARCNSGSRSGLRNGDRSMSPSPMAAWSGMHAARRSSASGDVTGRAPTERTRVIWVILAALGVPLWLCAAGILTFVLRNRSLRKRRGDVPVRLREDPQKRWRRGHAVWAHDVLSFRASPAAWNESLLWTTDARIREATPEERKHLHRLGDNPLIATFTLFDGGTVEAAVAAGSRAGVAGPYAS